MGVLTDFEDEIQQWFYCILLVMRLWAFDVTHVRDSISMTKQVGYWLIERQSSDINWADGISHGRVSFIVRFTIATQRCLSSQLVFNVTCSLIKDQLKLLIYHRLCDEVGTDADRLLEDFGLALGHRL